MPELNEFEIRVMRALLEGSDPMLEKLREQFSKCSVLNRDLTGVGFFTHFSAACPLDPVAPANFVIDDVGLTVQDLEYGASAILFIRNGVIDLLEIVANAGNWPQDAVLVSVGYLKKKTWTDNVKVLEASEVRDLEVTRMAWG